MSRSLEDRLVPHRPVRSRTPLLRSEQTRGLLLVPVARDLDEVEFHVEIDLADEIRAEEYGALEDAQGDEFLTGEIARDFLPHLFATFRNVGTAD